MTLVDRETGEIVELDAESARDLTDRIKLSVQVAWDQVVQAYLGRAWTALGYSSWDEYCVREFEGAKLRLPREIRNDTVRSLRDAGLSQRAIGAAMGLGVGTVNRASNSPGVPNGTPHAPESESEAPTSEPAPEPEAPPAPAPVTGVDGKKYAANKPKPPPHPDDVFRGEALKAIDKTNHLLELPAEKVVLLADPQDREDLARLARDLRSYADDLEHALAPGLKAVN